MLSIIILTLYVGYCIVRWGLPNSVSQTWRNSKWLFMVAMVTGFGLMSVPLIEVLPDAYRSFGFFAAMSGVFIGLAPNMSDELQEKVHMTAAVVLGISSQGIVAVLNAWLLLGWIALIPMAVADRKRIVFWAEMVGGALMYSAIICKYIKFG